MQMEIDQCLAIDFNIKDILISCLCGYISVMAVMHFYLMLNFAKESQFIFLFACCFLPEVIHLALCWHLNNEMELYNVLVDMTDLGLNELYKFFYSNIKYRI